MQIKDKFIGKENPCFIIAEAGSNFAISKDPETNFKQALTLIDKAVEAKVDAIKFQLFKAEKIYTKQAGNAEYIKDEKSIFDIIKDM